MLSKKITDCKLNFLWMVLLGWVSLGWIDPLADKVREGNQFYNDGKYDEALDKYVDAQINAPDRTQLDFNIADAQYKRNKYNEAAQLFEKITKSGDLEMKAKSGFNMGNTLYRQGKMKEALECYKKAIDFIDEAEPEGGGELDTLKNDAKYNYEYVERKMKENEQKQQGQDQKDQQQEEGKKDDGQQPDNNNGAEKEKQESQDNKQEPKPEDTREKNEDKKDTNHSQSGEDEQKDRRGEQQQPQPQGQRQMSREEADRFLEALNHAEKETRLMKRDAQRSQHRSVEKDW
ncbi:MAG: tetratricopeptide repeat protein [Candidatus Brocadia sp.]|nr:tetratricopeptide repeat protein [Candidatus Brocadia sp.]